MATTARYLAGDPLGIDNMYVALVTAPIMMLIERLFRWPGGAPLRTEPAA